MKKVSFALAILALAVWACSFGPNAQLPTQAATPLAKPMVALATATNALATVTAAESLHVRNSPPVGNPPTEYGLVIGYLAHGDIVTLTGVCQDGWAQIQWKQNVAWVNARYLSDNKCKQ